MAIGHMTIVRLLAICLLLEYAALARPVPINDPATLQGDGAHQTHLTDAVGGLFGRVNSIGPYLATDLKPVATSPASRLPSISSIKTAAAPASSETATRPSGVDGACRAQRSAPSDPKSSGNIGRTFTEDQFLGFHGTQNINAASFEANGISKPDLTSGADQELGPGIYITDDLFGAQVFANNAVANVKHLTQKQTTQKVCKIFAKDLALWKAFPKLWFPATDAQGRKLVGDSSDVGTREQLEQDRKKFATQNHLPSGTVNSGNFVRFSFLDPRRSNQMAIPQSFQSNLAAQCFDPTDLVLQNSPPSFKSQITTWNIIVGCGVT